MGEQHLSDALLSGHLDHELSALDERRARLHLAGCASCGARLATFSRLEVQLAAEPALGCASVMSLVSAQLDGELSDEADSVARAHLASCRTCQTDLTFWSRLDDAIVALPAAAPSAWVDQAIRELVQPRRGRSVRRGLALRGALVTVVAVIAVLLSGLPRSLPERATPALPGGSPVLVASVQQAVLNPKNNTLYVLETEQASVAARDAGTNSLITRIAVGGRPIALALDETANAILVLDAQAKTITTIDSKANAVVASSAVAVAGTPTGLQAAAGKIVVTAVADPKAAASASGSTASGGLVAILNSTSKQLETVRTVDVAPRLIVLDPSGSLALLVGPDGSVIADASSYKQIGDKLPGGVAGAFGGDNGATIAVLSADVGGAKVTFGGQHAPAALSLAGKPIALTSLPGGGYGVLLDVGGRGQVVTISVDGRAVGVPTDVALVGSDLTFDSALGRYAVTGPNGVRFAGVVASVTSPPPSSPNPAGSPAPSSRPSASPSSAKPTQSTTPMTSPSVAVAEPLVPDGARLLWTGTYAFGVAGNKLASVVGGSGTRLWFVDQFNILDTLDTVSGRASGVVPLPRDAKINLIATSPNFVYAIDGVNAKVYALDLGAQRLQTNPIAAVANAVAAATTPDDRLWVVTGTASLVGFDPNTRRAQVVDIPGASLLAVAADSSGRVWFVSEDDRQAIGSYDSTSRTFTEFKLQRRGAVTALTVDPTGALLVGTDAGELFTVRDRSLSLAANAGGPIIAFTVEAGRTAWYASREPGGVRFAPIDGSVAAALAPSGATGLSIDSLRRAWLPDRSTGGFYIVLQNVR